MVVNAGGDGIDSNGDLLVTGGETYVWGPSDNANGALDYAGSASVTGGVFIAVGSTGMAMGFGSSSTQYSAMVNSSGSGGAELVITDSAGSTLISCVPAKAYSSVIFSAPGMAEGETYTLSSGGVELASVTLSGIATNAGGGMGGMQGGMGGGRGQGGFTAPDGGTAPGTEGGNAPETPSGSGMQGQTPPAMP